MVNFARPQSEGHGDGRDWQGRQGAQFVRLTCSLRIYSTGTWKSRRGGREEVMDSATFLATTGLSRTDPRLRIRHS